MRRFRMCTVIAAATILLMAGLADAQQVVTLKVAHFQTSSSNFNKFVLVPWCEKIAKESGGQLKCQIYPSMQLGGAPSQLFDQARDGVADIVWTIPTYQAGRFTKTEVFELPYMVSMSEQGSQALWEYIQKNSLDEFKGVKLLSAHFNDGNQLYFGSKQVKNMEDLKGLKVRTPTRLAAKTLTALGAIPVQMPAPAVPEALSKSVVDGACISWEVTTSLKLQEVCKTVTESAPREAKLSNVVMTLVMNPSKYNSLSPELKKVIDNNSGLEMSKWFGAMHDSFTAPARNIAVNRHNTINVLTSAEQQRWVKATKQVNDAWFKEVASKGGDGRALYNEAKAFLKKYND